MSTNAPPTGITATATQDASGNPQIAVTVGTPAWSNLLTPVDASFETGVGSAVGIGGVSTVAQSLAGGAVDGSYSLAMTATTTAYNGMNFTATVPVAFGQTYNAVASVKASSTARNWSIAITWSNAVGNSLSTSVSTAVLDSSTGWTSLAVSGVAPSSAVKASVAVYTLAAQAIGEVHYVDAIALNPGASSPWSGGGGNVALVVARSDGYYLPNADPINGISLQATPGFATFIDTTAPYGLQASYTAVLVYSGFPSAPVGATAYMGNSVATNRLWGYLPRFARDNDANSGYPFLRFLAGMCDQQQVIDNLIRDQGGAPGWSQAMDINRCPTFALPWLAQFVGVRLDPTLRDDQMRYAIRNAGGFQRGTPGAVVAAVNQYLISGYAATLVERDTSPYHFSISIPSAGISGSATCQSLWLAYPSCSALYAGSGGTGTFTACSQLWSTNGLINAAVTAAIPAGLVAAISYY